MSVSRLEHITKIGVEQMGDMADSLNDPSSLRLENLDTNILPPVDAVDFTRNAIIDDDANSYLPFLGLDSLRQAATDLVSRQSRQTYDWKTESLISAGGLSGILNVLFAMLEPGDEVLMTDPTYVGLINRVRLAGGVVSKFPVEVVGEKESELYEPPKVEAGDKKGLSGFWMIVIALIAALVIFAIAKRKKIKKK